MTAMVWSGFASFRSCLARNEAHSSEYYLFIFYFFIMYLAN